MQKSYCFLLKQEKMRHLWRSNFFSKDVRTIIANYIAVENPLCCLQKINLFPRQVEKRLCLKNLSKLMEGLKMQLEFSSTNLANNLTVHILQTIVASSAR